MTEAYNLNDAVLLYEAIGKYVPVAPDLPDDIVDFIGKIINNIQDNKDFMAYSSAIQIMTGATFNVLKEQSSDDILRLFTNGLMEWRIIELVEFFREVGYQDA